MNEKGWKMVKQIMKGFWNVSKGKNIDLTKEYIKKRREKALRRGNKKERMK